MNVSSACGEKAGRKEWLSHKKAPHFALQNAVAHYYYISLPASEYLELGLIAVVYCDCNCMLCSFV